MENVKQFDIDKAFYLEKYYRYYHEFTKQQILKELIDYQMLFGDYSIMGARLSIHCQDKSIIISVLKDMGYYLKYFNTFILRGPGGEIYGRNTEIEISFSKTEA